MMIFLFNFLLILSFSMSWDMPESYKAPTKKQFSKSRTNIPKYFPDNTIFINSIRVGDLLDKMSYRKIMETELSDFFLNELRNEGVPRKIRSFIQEPILLGFDLDSPIYTFGAGDYIDERGPKNFIFGMIFSIKDYELFELNVATLIDLIPDREVDIFDGKLNSEFNYTIFKDGSRDVIGLCYDENHLLVLITDDRFNLKSELNSLVIKQNSFYKQGIDLLNDGDINMWLDITMLKDLSEEFYEELYYELDFSEDEIDLMINDINRGIDATPYLIINSSSNTDNINFNFKSLVSSEGSDIWNESLEILDKKIGNKIIQKISINSLANMGFSFDIIAFEKLFNKYSEQYNFTEFEDDLNNFTYDYDISKNELLNIFDGNFIISVNDIDFRNEKLDAIFIAGLGNADGLINIIDKLSVNGQLPIEFPKIYKNEIIDISVPSSNEKLYLLIENDFIYLGSLDALRNTKRNNNFKKKIIKNNPKDLNFFSTISLDQMIDFIPTRTREDRQVKSFLRSLKLGSLNMEYDVATDHSEINFSLDISSMNQNPLEFIIFNLIPIIEDEVIYEGW